MPVTTTPPTGKTEVEEEGKEMETEAGNTIDPVAAIVARVAAGESVRSCTDKPGAPTRNQFRRALRKDPELGGRYDAAIAKWTRSHARSREHFDAIERRIRAGEILATIFETKDPSFPDAHSFRKFLKSSPAHAERYRAAFRFREASPNARGAAPKFTDLELRQAAAALAASPTRYVSIRRIVPKGIHFRTMSAARARGGDLCAEIEGAMLARISRLKINFGPLFKPLTTGLIVPRRIRAMRQRRRRAAGRVYEKDILKRALSRNEIYAAIDASVPWKLNPIDRDDIIAQTVLEVIEDGLDLDIIADVAREVIANHFESRRLRQASLDAPLHSDSTLTLGDTLTTGWD